MPLSTSTAAVRYMPIGDSYTIGTGIGQNDAWPGVLTRHLQAEGVDIELLGNPARNGWTAQDAIEGELPEFEQAKPNFATLFIGVNDYVQGSDAEQFRMHLRTLLDRMLAVLPSPERLIVGIIPDYSVTPTGKQYALGRDVASGLAAFNDVIRDETEARNVAVVDFAAIADAMRNDASLIGSDGLHPSESGHLFWEAQIHPIVAKALKRP